MAGRIEVNFPRVRSLIPISRGVRRTDFGITDTLTGLIHFRKLKLEAHSDVFQFVDCLSF